MVADSATLRVLTDGIITLRPPDEADIDAIYQACQDPEIQRWTGVPSPYHREHAIAYLQRVRAGAGGGQDVRVPRRRRRTDRSAPSA